MAIPIVYIGNNGKEISFKNKLKERKKQISSKPNIFVETFYSSFRRNSFKTKKSYENETLSENMNNNICFKNSSNKSASEAVSCGENIDKDDKKETNVKIPTNPNRYYKLRVYFAERNAVLQILCWGTLYIYKLIELINGRFCFPNVEMVHLVNRRTETELPKGYSIFDCKITRTEKLDMFYEDTCYTPTQTDNITDFNLQSPDGDDDTTNSGPVSTYNLMENSRISVKEKEASDKLLVSAEKQEMDDNFTTYTLKLKPSQEKVELTNEPNIRQNSKEDKINKVREIQVEKDETNEEAVVRLSSKTKSKPSQEIIELINEPITLKTKSSQDKLELMNKADIQEVKEPNEPNLINNAQDNVLKKKLSQEQMESTKKLSISKNDSQNKRESITKQNLKKTAIQEKIDLITKSGINKKDIQNKRESITKLPLETKPNQENIELTKKPSIIQNDSQNKRESITGLTLKKKSSQEQMELIKKPSISKTDSQNKLESMTKQPLKKTTSQEKLELTTKPSVNEKDSQKKRESILKLPSETKPSQEKIELNNEANINEQDPQNKRESFTKLSPEIKSSHEKLKSTNETSVEKPVTQADVIQDDEDSVILQSTEQVPASPSTQNVAHLAELMMASMNRKTSIITDAEAELKRNNTPVKKSVVFHEVLDLSELQPYSHEISKENSAGNEHVTEECEDISIEEVANANTPEDTGTPNLEKQEIPNKNDQSPNEVITIDQEKNQQNSSSNLKEVPIEKDDDKTVSKNRSNLFNEYNESNYLQYYKHKMNIVEVEIDLLNETSDNDSSLTDSY